ncbi:MAG TPA: DUF1801 domain-containing protein [Polyangiaceae bacterium]
MRRRRGTLNAMAKTDFKSVTEYLATLPKDTRATLERVRVAIRKAVPGAEEGISYQIPAFKLEGSPVIYFAGWKEHYAVYPATKKVVASFKAELAGYELSKGTIRFPLSEPVPTKLIAAIAKVRGQETAELLAERKAKRSKGKKQSTTSKKSITSKKPKASKRPQASKKPKAGKLR